MSAASTRREHERESHSNFTSLRRGRRNERSETQFCEKKAVCFSLLGGDGKGIYVTAKRKGKRGKITIPESVGLRAGVCLCLRVCVLRREGTNAGLEGFFAHLAIRLRVGVVSG